MPLPPPVTARTARHAGGTLEFLFVLQDKADPAYAAISQLARQQAEQGGGGGRAVRLHCAGAADRTSQKIHK